MRESDRRGSSRPFGREPTVGGRRWQRKTVSPKPIAQAPTAERRRAIFRSGSAYETGATSVCLPILVRGHPRLMQMTHFSAFVSLFNSERHILHVTCFDVSWKKRQKRKILTLFLRCVPSRCLLLVWMSALASHPPSYYLWYNPDASQPPRTVIEQNPRLPPGFLPQSSRNFFFYRK